MIRNKTLITLFVSLFFTFFVHANELDSVNEENSFVNISAISGQNETVVPKYQAKVLYTKYKSHPKVVFTKQRFDITVSLSVFLDDDQFFRISSEMSGGKNIELLSEEIVWYMTEDKKYETTLKFKAGSEAFVFPNINIDIMDRDGVLIDSEVLKKPEIHFRKIAINQKRYSNVIANDLEVVTVKATQFSNDEIMVVLEIEAQNGNLEEFQITKYENQGLKDIVTQKNSQKIYYFVMVPIDRKSVV